MKRVFLMLYAILVSVVLVSLLLLCNTYILEYPKITIAILGLLMLTSIGCGVRSMIEMAILWPMIKITDGKSNSFKYSTVIFAIFMVLAIVIPWINGVSTFSVWNWISSIAFTMFNFETFYSLFGATLRIYRTDEQFD